MHIKNLLLNSAKRKNKKDVIICICVYIQHIY